MHPCPPPPRLAQVLSPQTVQQTNICHVPISSKCPILSGPLAAAGSSTSHTFAHLQSLVLWSPCALRSSGPPHRQQSPSVSPSVPPRTFPAKCTSSSVTCLHQQTHVKSSWCRKRPCPPLPRLAQVLSPQTAQQLTSAMSQHMRSVQASAAL